MKHFKLSEFNCRCCGRNEMKPSFLEMIDQARNIAGIPFVVNSGYRCQKHNAAVGSTSSNHTNGVAADISCTDGPSRLKMIRALLEVGFNRVGIAKTFIHADCNTGPNSIWFY